MPTISVHGYFYAASVFSILFHICVLLIRANSRKSVDNGDMTELSNIGGVRAYGLLGWTVWISCFVILPLISIGVTVIVNQYDGTAHRRYLQYLLLEFDTRLGMHSPR